MDRDFASKSIWNRMGFPSSGVEAVFEKLRKIEEPHFTPIFVNVGKNRDTALAGAANDYATVMRRLKTVADVFVVNISSPNTAHLRELQEKSALRQLLQELQDSQDDFSIALKVTDMKSTNGKSNDEKSTNLKSPPVLLKLSPDLSDLELDQVLEISLASPLVDGWIFTNTTLSRTDGSPFPPEGGVSGAPLCSLSRDILKKAIQRLGKDRQNRLIVSCGGVMSPEEVGERLRMGADLVQVYSALIYSGPFFFRQVAKAHLKTN